MNSVYRPWGQIAWLLPKLGSARWSLLGVLGTEDRCIATADFLNPNIQSQKFLKILDPHQSPEASFTARYSEIETRFNALGVSMSDIRTVSLMQDIDTINAEVDSFLGTSGSEIVLDVTSMPKRWFFPVMRFLLADARVSTLVVTYTSAEKYGEQLSSDPAAVGPLPTFDEPRAVMTYDELVVGVGFAPLGLKDLFEAQIGKIRYFFPFPPGPPNFFRNWHFLRTLESEVENRNLRVEDRWHIYMYDVCGAFDALRRITKNGDHTSALAPFGPKTLSLAMCMFALAVEKANKVPVHVYYTQPRRYALDYSSGIGLQNGSPDIKAYCVRLNGRDLYAV